MKRRTFLASPAVLALACRRKPQKTVAVIPKATSHAFWIAVQAGCTAAAQEFNLDLLWNGPAVETDYARQIQIVDAMVVRHVDGLAVAATERGALLAPVVRAIDAGIPVTVFDSGLDTERAMSQVITDNVEVGRLAGRKLGQLMKGTGKTAILMNAPGSASSLDRESGFREVIAKEFPGISIAAEQFGQADRARARSAAENILAANRDLGGFFASTELSAVGVSLAIKGRDLGGKVKFVAVDANEVLLEDMRKGVVDALIVQDPFKMGYETVKTLATKLAGGVPPKKVELHARVIAATDLSDPEVIKLLSPDIEKYLR